MLFLYLLFATLLLFQIFYIVASLLNTKIVGNKEHKTSKFSITIPIFNCEKTISKHYDSILRNDLSYIDKIIIVLDHCTDNSGNITNIYKKLFERKGVRVKVIKFVGKKRGKTNAILEGAKFVKTKNTFLLDADIILWRNAIKELSNFHIKNGNSYSSCFEYPYQDKNHALVSQIICNDRLYRQNILQRVRNKYNMANFPGGIGVVNVRKYKQFLKSGFLEDLTSTYNILGSNEKISLYTKPLAYEIERQSFKGLILQRVRWTIGNIENLPLLIKTILKVKGISKKFILISYPVLWYLQHYLIVSGLISFFFLPKLIFLLPCIFYLFQIIISVTIGREYYKNSIFGVLIHVLIFPIIITFVLFKALSLIIKNKKLYFRTKSTNILFERI